MTPERAAPDTILGRLVWFRARRREIADEMVAHPEGFDGLAIAVAVSDNQLDELIATAREGLKAPDA